MAPEEKPYRVYRGGRTKGKVPAPARPGRPKRDRDGRRDRGGTGEGGGGDAAVYYRGPGAKPRRVSWGKRIGLALGVILLLVLAWAVTSYLSFHGGVKDANKRLDANARLALTEQSGLLMSHPTTILLLGTDTAQVGGRQGDRHSDSMQLLRVDGPHHRLSFLSIPRDMEVPIEGVGQAKINAAYQNGGAALAIKTVRQFTGIPINHVMVIDFADFKDLIDALGGVTVDVPKAIRSNRFDCPYPTQARCQAWQGWRFPKGKQTLNGQRALIYSRIRENMLDLSESDFTRGARQQAVIQAVGAKFTSPSTLVKLPFKGSKMVKPLTTDMSTGQLLQLGWIRFRADDGRALHCRLGGDQSSTSSNIIPSEDNRNVISMFEGTSAPQPPPPGQSYAPGCLVGRTLQ
jgi:LCP family protein required for cell wall assembly